MAKRPTKNAPASEKTTTYSTRLNQEQREQLEEAAALAGVSASRFIRDATLRAVADTLNASPPNDRALAAMARKVAEQLARPCIEVIYDNTVSGYDHQETRLIGLARKPVNIGYASEDSEDRWGYHPTAVSSEVLSERLLHQLAEIVESCPHSFINALLAELRSGAEPAPEFKPKTDSRKLLND